MKTVKGRHISRRRQTYSQTQTDIHADADRQRQTFQQTKADTCADADRHIYARKKKYLEHHTTARDGAGNIW